MNIKRLTLFTANLNSIKQFYSQTLGFPIISSNDQKVVFKTGTTELAFKKQKSAKPYHFAFNIPSNQENEALNWLKDRVKVLEHDGQKIHDFDFWQAKALYFYDPDNNIVEFIARRKLNKPAKSSFSIKSIISVSEIGIPTLDIEDVLVTLEETTRINMYDGNTERFCAIGDEEGLFIVVNRSVKNWFPTDDTANEANFEIEFSIRNDAHHFYCHSGKLIEIEF